MRPILLACAALLIPLLVACGGGGDGSTRKAKSKNGEATLSLEQAPTGTNDGGITAKLTYYKQTDRYLVVKLSITNNGKDAVLFKNGDGTQMPGFRATSEGQTFVAERKGGTWNPWTGYRPAAGGGSNNLEVPAGVTAALELRWNFQVPSKSYDWSVTVSNMQVGDKKLADIALSLNGPAAAPAK